MLVTPGRAAVWLTASHSDQRPIDLQRVLRLRDWLIAGHKIREPIVFDELGRLIDGHHRLLEILINGHSRTYTVWNHG